MTALPQPQLSRVSKKKRARVSQRTPTTVLTTNKSNFRQMVQEFTGIPMDPFTFPAFQPSGANLFHSTPAASSTMRSSSAPVRSSSFGSFAAPPTSVCSNDSGANPIPTSTYTNHQLPFDVGLNNHAMQNTISTFSFQPLLQSPQITRAATTAPLVSPVDYVLPSNILLVESDDCKTNCSASTSLPEFFMSKGQENLSYMGEAMADSWNICSLD